MKNKRITFLMLGAIFLVFFACLNASVPHAEEAVVPSLKRIVFDSSVPYLFLDPITATDASDDAIVVSDDSGKISVLSGLSSTNSFERIEEYPAASIATRVAYFDGAVFSLQDDKIIVDTTSTNKLLKGSYTNFRLDKQTDTLFAIGDGKLFEYDINGLLRFEGDLIDESYHLVKETVLSHVVSADITAFTATSDYIYFAVVSQNSKSYDDIYRLDRTNGAILRIYERSTRINEIIYLNNFIYTLSDGDITKYRIFDGMLSSEKTFEANAVTLNVNGNKFFMATSNSNMLSCNNELEGISTLFQAESSSQGFFSTPASAYTRRDNLFVADYSNGRLFAAGKNGKKTVSGFKSINSVVSDNHGNVFVSYDINKVAKLNGSLELVESVSLERAVKKLVIDINNNLYIVTASGLYLLSSSLEATKLEGLESVIDVSFVMGSGKIIYYDGSKMYLRQSPLLQGQSTLLFERQGITAFAADYEGNIFFTDTDGKLFKYWAKDGSISGINVIKPSYMDLRFVSSIYISNIKNEYVDFGDLVFADKLRHCIYTLPMTATEVVISDPNFVMPDIVQSTPLTSQTPLVYKVKEAAEIFNGPIEISGGQVIEAGKRIFYYDQFNSYEEFAFIIYEDLDSEKLICGYVFRNLLDLTAYDYSAPPSRQGVVYIENTPVYRWPSVHSTKLESLGKDYIVSLCDFSAPMEGSNQYSAGTYTDSNGRIWYRINLESNKYGFIQAVNISVNQYSPPETPKYNAQIKEFEGVKFAYLYYLDQRTNTYKLIEGESPLPAGTRIEIIKTPLDPQSEFTEIRIFRSGLGTLTCYVRTEHIKYDTVNILQIVAIIALIIVIISAIILIVYYRKYRRKKETSAKDAEEAEETQNFLQL